MARDWTAAQLADIAGRLDGALASLEVAAEWGRGFKSGNDARKAIGFARLVRSDLREAQAELCTQCGPIAFCRTHAP